jgi:hypothetical protein
MAEGGELSVVIINRGPAEAVAAHTQASAPIAVRRKNLFMKQA